MLQIALDPQLETHLGEIARRVGEEPSEIARRALLAYIEDLEDYAIAVEAWQNRDPTKAIPIEELMREFGVAD